MRISDWSSDVCSADLEAGRKRRPLFPTRQPDIFAAQPGAVSGFQELAVSAGYEGQAVPDQAGGSAAQMMVVECDALWHLFRAKYGLCDVTTWGPGMAGATGAPAHRPNFRQENGDGGKEGFR